MLELTIIGNVGKDPEARYTADGALVCGFSVAHSRKNGGQEETVWVEVSAWRELGERCSAYVKKGDKVFVRGYPEVRAFTRKNGEPGAALHLTAQNVQFLGGGKRQAGGGDDESEIPF